MILFFQINFKFQRRFLFYVLFESHQNAAVESKALINVRQNVERLFLSKFELKIVV